jgi:predicted dehydrogenase
MPRKVVIGYGNAARIHGDTFPEAETIGVVETDPQKRKAAESLGLKAYKSLGEVVANRLAPDYFDVATPTDLHLSDVKSILLSYPTANILVEKPVCESYQTAAFEALWKKSTSAKISVNENYKSSKIVKTIAKYVEDYEIKRPKISIEFSKNRILDVEKGRFIDECMGAFGYEGPHMLTCLMGTDGNKRIREITNSALTPMILSNGATKKFQGDAELDYRAIDGSQVHFFTSMIGNTRVALPEFAGRPNYSIRSDPSERYRVMTVEKGPVSITGMFEPIPGKERNQGMVVIKDKETESEKIINLVDNTMRAHQENVVAYFEGRADNPCDVRTSLGIVEDLDKAVRHAKGSH